MARSKTPSRPAPAGSGKTHRGAGGETHQQAAPGSEVLTTNLGIPVADNQNSLRAGPRGPSLLEDFVLREKIHHFDHERIPERIVHARGSAAKGIFTLTRSLERYTRARILTEVGAETEVFVRFSTVAGGAGSVDTPRDVRGFAVKFYTKDGNWDLVGNNIPVFFIQDAMKFPDLVHAVKMEADRGYPQAASAHDTFWDFVGLMPETAHMIMWAMSDRTLPRSLRMMEGFGVHSFRLVNEAGERCFVKFHWKPRLGLQSTLWDEAVKIAGADPDYHRRDLYEAIRDGHFPEWDLGVQIITEAMAEALPFDILDATKLVPEEMVPVEIIGTMVLNANPDNFFAETEQVAFLPSNLPPGIDVSEDPLLQGRLFSYLDTQLKRLGTPNWHQLPVNRAKGCPVHNFQRDGQMRFDIPKGRANYEPNSLAAAGEPAGPRETPRGIAAAATRVEGSKVRLRAESFADHYSQARLFFRSQTAVEQDHMVAALVFELSKVQLEHVRLRVLAGLRNVEETLARRVATGLGLADLPEAAPAAAPVQAMEPSPALRLTARGPLPLKGRAVALLVTDGARAKEVAGLRDACAKAGAVVKVIAQKLGGVTLDDGRALAADGQLAGSPSVLFDAVAVLASEAGCDALLGDSAAVDFVTNAFVHLKAIGFSAAAKPLLDRCAVEPDELVVPARKPADFAQAAARRLWDREPRVRPRP
jgi:catalase